MNKSCKFLVLVILNIRVMASRTLPSTVAEINGIFGKINLDRLNLYSYMHSSVTKVKEAK